MSALQQFIFPITSEPVRVQMLESEPWFHLSDLCKILSIKNPSELITQFETSNKRTVPLSAGKPPWFIDEEALYTIVLRCQGALKPGTVAYQFRKWVINVIKTIRKTGSYQATEADQAHFTPFGITLQRKIQECDRAIETAVIGEGNIRKIVADRKALESVYKTQPKVTSEAETKALAAQITKIKQFLIKNQNSPNFIDLPAPAKLKVNNPDLLGYKNKFGYNVPLNIFKANYLGGLDYKTILTELQRQNLIMVGKSHYTKVLHDTPNTSLRVVTFKHSLFN